MSSLDNKIFIYFNYLKNIKIYFFVVGWVYLLAGSSIISGSIKKPFYLF